MTCTIKQKRTKSINEIVKTCHKRKGAFPHLKTQLHAFNKYQKVGTLKIITQHKVKHVCVRVCVCNVRLIREYVEASLIITDHVTTLTCRVIYQFAASL